MIIHHISDNGKRIDCKPSSAMYYPEVICWVLALVAEMVKESYAMADHPTLIPAL
ncbi:hypothetical protein LEADMMO150B3_19515 [Leclercia adecarboxylata]